MADAVKMTKLHYERWTEFLQNDSNQINAKEQELLARLHSIYYKHSYYLPCTCSPKTWNRWIEQVNMIYKNGIGGT